LPPNAQATPIATTPSQHLLQAFFARPAELVAPELIGWLLVKLQEGGELLWGVIVRMASALLLESDQWQMTFCWLNTLHLLAFLPCSIDTFG